MDDGERLFEGMRQLAEKVGMMKVPTGLIEDLGRRDVMEAALAHEIRRRYRCEADKNDDDGFYAAVLMCRHCNPNHEVMKSAWIFETKDDAMEYADIMLQSIIREKIAMIDDGD